MTPAPASPPPPLSAIGAWAWRLAPLFAVIAAATVWNLWSTAGEDHEAIRDGLHARSAQWQIIKQITGRSVAR